MDCLLPDDAAVEHWFVRNRDTARAMTMADVDAVGAWLPIVGVPANDRMSGTWSPLCLVGRPDRKRTKILA